MVGCKFAAAVFFAWFLSRKLGDFDGETSAQRKARVAAIEDWTNDIYQTAPGRYRPTVREKQSAFALPKVSRYSRADSMLPSLNQPPPYGYSKSHTASSLGPNRRFSSSMTDPFMSPSSRPSTPSPSSPSRERSSIGHSLYDSSLGGHAPPSTTTTPAGTVPYCPFELSEGMIPQPPADFEPFGFPLMRQFMLVTAYSESIEGLRTTLDSLATTDYPNSHKTIVRSPSCTSHSSLSVDGKRVTFASFDLLRVPRSARHRGWNGQGCRFDYADARHLLGDDEGIDRPRARGRATLVRSSFPLPFPSVLSPKKNLS